MVEPISIGASILASSTANYVYNTLLHVQNEFAGRNDGSGVQPLIDTTGPLIAGFLTAAGDTVGESALFINLHSPNKAA